jgi:ADP-ribose pyrophosphatase YjhB (NUDIX family)
VPKIGNRFKFDVNKIARQMPLLCVYLLVITTTNTVMIDKLAWIELHNGAVLSTRSKGKEVYYLPGGKREAWEDDAQALAREIKEELSVEITPGSMQLMGVFTAQAHGHASGVMVQMTCYTASYTGQLQAAAEIEEFVWLTYANRHQVSAVDKIIFDWLWQKGLLK